MTACCLVAHGSSLPCISGNAPSPCCTPALWPCSGGGSSHLYLMMARTGEPGPKGISAFLIEKVRLINVGQDN